MQASCHRCHGDLPAGQPTPPFCPHCGAPQLRLSEEAQAAATSAPNTTGELPPPRPRLLNWSIALRSALEIAGIGAALNLLSTRIPGLGILAVLWVLCAALLTLALYGRREPRKSINAGIGARIGILSGLTNVALLGAVLAIAGLLARFRLHSLAAFDTALHDQMRLQVEHALAANPAPPELVRFLNSPEFQAGALLSGLVTFALSFLLLSVVSGTLAGIAGNRTTQTAQPS